MKPFLTLLGLLAVGVPLATQGAEKKTSPKPSAKRSEQGGFTGATPKPSTSRKAGGGPPTERFAAPASPEPAAASSPTASPASPGTAKPTPKPAAKTDDREATRETGGASPERAPNATIDPGELAEFAAQPPRVQQLLLAALDLTKLNLTYKYGRADPKDGGMDCSGTIYYLLRSQGFADVPRDASGQYVWARKKSQFQAVISRKAESFEFKDLRPGDLLFWNGTYGIERDPPVTHTMIYLGMEKKTKKRLMFGASDGRSYNGTQRWGVSVFDFKMPPDQRRDPEKPRIDFLGYATIPGLRDGT
ncbi:MAG: NlpC/P60 family protein [Verrucomicrobiota bacterium]|nr:NlpC/P60 family protein [Verrucomicrobiota bacterium]